MIHGTHRATRQEYAIKVLDKGHLKRNNKLNTALAEKNTLVRLGSGHPGIVRLHWAFQDDWSLCEFISFTPRAIATAVHWLLPKIVHGHRLNRGLLSVDARFPHPPWVP